MSSSPSVSNSSLSSSEYLADPPPPEFTARQLKTIKKLNLECLRKSSSAFMIAAVVVMALGAILIGVSQAGYLPAESPLYAFAGSIPFILVAVALDSCLRSRAKESNIDLQKYYDIYQRPDPKPNS